MNKRRLFFKKIGLFTVWATPIIRAVKLPAHAQTSELACSDEVVTGIRITVIDSATSENISCVATATISEGSYTEMLLPINCSNDGVLEGAFERPGVYQVVITATDYISAAPFEVEVSEDECHVITEILEFSLDPQ